MPKRKKVGSEREDVDGYSELATSLLGRSVSVATLKKYDKTWDEFRAHCRKEIGFTQKDLVEYFASLVGTYVVTGLVARYSHLQFHLKKSPHSLDLSSFSDLQDLIRGQQVMSQHVVRKSPCFSQEQLTLFWCADEDLEGKVLYDQAASVLGTFGLQRVAGVHQVFCILYYFD
jgi:hypothetical protein